MATKAAKKKTAIGEFCWIDMGTRDVAAAKKFYRGLFGWEFTDQLIPKTKEKYTLIRLGRKVIGGMYPIKEEQKKMGPMWIPYISVAKADTSATYAKSCGGKLIAGPMNVMEKGRMALVIDPTGAIVALWQAKKRLGAEISNVPGAVCWHDLSTLDPPRAGDFYQRVFGWKTRDRAISGNAYHVFQIGEKQICGMWPQALRGFPPCWITHWQVKNCAKTVEKARKMGGNVIVDTTPVPGIHFAILSDPGGAPFGIIEFGKQR